MHRTRNAAYGQPYRGFESLPLRHLLVLHIRSESPNPGLSAAFGMIRIHVHPCQSTGDRLEMWERMWEIWWYGKALCDRRSEEHTSELQSLMRSSYAVFCLKKKTK